MGDESLKRMENEALKQQKETKEVPCHKVLKDVIVYDEHGNKKIVEKLVDEVGPKKAPNSNDLKSTMVTVTDSEGNEIQKHLFTDDQGNVINESDIEYVTEAYTDEHGLKQQKQVPKIKDESLKRMENEALKQQKEDKEVPCHKVLKDVIVFDEVGPKKAPKSNDLKSTMITVTDSDGNEIQKHVFTDDQGNVINESDIEYVTEAYTDEHGLKQQKQVPKIKDESLKRMENEALKQQKETKEVPCHKVLKDVIVYD